MSEHEHNHHLPAADSAEELTAVLEFMLRHNISHTGELDQLADKLRQTGKTEAADGISAALGKYNEGNSLLAEALRALK